MPRHYIYKCANCSYEAKRYRNVSRCPWCQGDLKRVPHEPQLRLCFIGTSGSIEVSSISPKTAAKNWPEEFTALLEEMCRAG